MLHFKLWSDIGGASGLMLGMSFATFIGILDWLVSLLVSRKCSFASKYIKFRQILCLREHEK